MASVDQVVWIGSATLAGADLTRATAVLFWLATCGVLTFVVNPGQRDLYASIVTGFSMAVIDYAAEIAAGHLGLWHYRLGRTWLGLPPDLLIDIFSAGYVICLLRIAVERQWPGRRNGKLFSLIMGVVLGTVALLHNYFAERQGLITFDSEVAPGTPLFVLGNYLLMTAVVAGVMLLFGFYRKPMGRKR